ncbi:MAG: hypothetical protein K2M98_06420, partial [Muribaculum sp.]|nr:hypothetical protein [Muribaculum sp.]
SWMVASAADAVNNSTYGYDVIQCQGSAMPYPERSVKDLAYPDSLTPVYLNHVGRHGARFLSSSKYTAEVVTALSQADSLNTITPTGQELRRLCDLITARTDGHWGALDSLGMAEQQAIATRAFEAYPMLFKGKKVNAISSYVARCVMSMDEFTHMLTRLNDDIEIYTSSGPQNNRLVRFWECDSAYKSFMNGEEWHSIYKTYVDTHAPVSVAPRLLGENFPISDKKARDFSMNVYKVVTGCSAMGIATDISRYFTDHEINELWSIENLHHYLTHSASSISDVPATMASPLLSELICTIQNAVDGENPYSAMLRFGHAETLMPLLSLMRLPGCYYISDDFDTVGFNWRDFYVVPMASNLQMILFKAASGQYYLRIDLNEIPVPYIPGCKDVYVPWNKAYDYLTGCLSLQE